MKSRTMYFLSENTKRETTSYAGDKIDFEASSGANEAFGNHTPRSISITFGGNAYANFSGSVHITWELRIKINSQWYTIYSESSSMSIDNSNFDVNVSLNSNIISLLQSYPIQEITLYHGGSNDNRGITVNAKTTATCIIYYEEYISLPTVDKPIITAVSFEKNTDSFTIKWNPCVGSNGAPGSKVQYVVYYRDSLAIANGDQKYKETAKIEQTQVDIKRWFSPHNEDVEAYFIVSVEYDTKVVDSEISTCKTIWPKIQWSDGIGSIRAERRGNKVYVEWAPAVIKDGSAEITYLLFHGDAATGFMGKTQDTHMLINPAEYNKEVSYFVQAYFSFDDYYPDIWSNTAEIAIPSQVTYTVRCYLNVDGVYKWQDCTIKYHDGKEWIESIAKYHNGTDFIECCF